MDAALNASRILDHFRWRRWNSLLAGHGQYSLLVTAFQQTLIQQRILGGLQFIILPFIRVGNLYQGSVVCPVQLRTQRVRNIGPISSS